MNWKRIKYKIRSFFPYWTCPFKTWWKVRKYWIRPKFEFYFGPIGIRKNGVYEEDSTIMDKNGEPIIKKGDPKNKQVGIWTFVSWNYITSMPKWRKYLWPVTVMCHDIVWKDKYDSPRYEFPGTLNIIFGTNVEKAWQFCMLVKAPKVEYNIYPREKEYLRKHQGEDRVYHPEDDYWESMLNFLYYANKDFDKAVELWGESQWTTWITDSHGSSKEIKLGPSWDPKFMTNKGYSKYFKASHYKIFKI